jgi:hypothetical protein
VIVNTQQQKIAALEDKNRRVQQKNTDLENHLKGWQQENASLRKKLESQQQENASLKNQLKIQEEESKYLKAKVGDLQAMIAEKVAPTGNAGANMIGDAQVQARWNALCFSIRQFVAQQVRPPSKRVNSISELRTLTSIPETFLADQGGCCLLAQAVIWRILAEHVFGNGARMSHMFWAGKFSVGLRCLCMCFARLGG